MSAVSMDNPRCWVHSSGYHDLVSLPVQLRFENSARYEACPVDTCVITLKGVCASHKHA